MPSLEWKTDLDHGPVLAVMGRFVTIGGELAVTAGSRVYLYITDGGEYRPIEVHDTGETIIGLAVIRNCFASDCLLVCTPGGVWVLGLVRGELSPVLRFHPNSGARIIGVASGDLDADGRDEIVASTGDPDMIIVCRITGRRLSALDVEPWVMAKPPGTPGFLEALKGSGKNPALVAFKRDGVWGMARYGLTRRGLQGVHVTEGHPPGVTALVSGNFISGPGQQVAAGSAGGMVWLMGSGRKPEIIKVTTSLGTAVSALATSGNQDSPLLAGTPEGNVFVFNHPVQQRPDLEFSPVEGVSGLAALPGGRVAVGTVNGGLQVWSLSSGGKTFGYIVKPGDTLKKISSAFGVPQEDLLSLNENIKNTAVILPGQVIRIPAAADLKSLED